MILRFSALVLTVLAFDQAVAQQTAPVVNPLVRQLNDSFAAVYEKVAPAVVVVEVRGTTDRALAGLPEGLEFFFRNPDGRPGPARPEQGSGFLISPDGYIMTNYHVVESGLEGEITVHLKDGRKFPAAVAGADKKSDIAVLKIDAENLPVVELGDSDMAKVGEFAFAVGAPYDLPYTFTVGVISAKGRDDLTGNQSYEEYIQTDASIHPGNSGGPLCDLDGRVIGVNTMINVRGGLGFAVPSNIAREVGRQLIANGRVSRPWLGIGILGLADSEQARRLFPDLDKGVLVSNIDPGTPAYDSDLRPGDVILKVDGKEISRSRDLQREILGKKIGQEVRLDLWRAGRMTTVSVRTGEQPERVVRASNMVRPPGPVRSQPPQRKKILPGMSLHGLVLESAPGAGVGIRVTDIEPDSAAAAAGLQPGDVITEAGGQLVRNRQDLESLLAATDGSRGVMLMIDRDGQKTFAILKP